MHLRLGLPALLLLAVSTAASAATLTNQDDKEHKLTIQEGNEKKEIALKPTGVLEGLCPKGCVIRIGDSEDDEYILEGPEILSIDGGKIYDERPEGETQSAPGNNNVRPPPNQGQPTNAPSK